jgi:allophanate hydrolase subunit 1
MLIEGKSMRKSITLTLSQKHRLELLKQITVLQTELTKPQTPEMEQELRTAYNQLFVEYREVMKL